MNSVNTAYGYYPQWCQLSSICSSHSGNVFALLMLHNTVETMASGSLLLCGSFTPVELSILLKAMLSFKTNVYDFVKSVCFQPIGAHKCFSKSDVYANLWHPASGQKNFCQYMKNMFKFYSHPETLKTNFIGYV